MNKAQPDRITEQARDLCRLQEAITGAKMGTPESIATIDQLCERVEKMRESAAINTSKRLLDLVRYMRSELHQAGLITDDELVWLLTAADEGKMGQGSISARRLEDYDKLRARLDKFESAPVEAWRDGLSDELQKIVAAIDTDYERKVFNISFIQRRLKYGYVRAIYCANQLAALGAIEFRSNSEIIPLWQRRVSVTSKEET